MSNGSTIRRNRRFIKELSPSASSKLCFNNDSMNQNDDFVFQPSSDCRKDNIDNTKPSPPEVAFKDQADVTYVRNDVPVREAFSPRKSTRAVKKPCRLIEHCEVNVKY